MSAIIVLVCYMWLPGNYEECTTFKLSNVTVEVYCQRAQQLDYMWEEVEITKCEKWDESTEERTNG